ncbi:MAG: Crp/Fnr family transcriptional regulator [Lachnospiraceae bacterium]
MHEGDRSASLYIIILGIVRGYYIDAQGNDITKCFSMEDGILSSEGLRTEAPSTFTIECLEDCECVEVPYQIIYQLTEMNRTVLLQFNQFFCRR